MSSSWIALLPRELSAGAHTLYGSEISGREEFFGPAILGRFLQEHQAFSTCAAAESRVLEATGWSAAERDLWRKWARVAREKGLLVSVEEWLKLWVPIPGPSSPAPFRKVGIPTRNRPESLARCVRSVMEEAGRRGRALEITVADDSDTKEHREAGREALSLLAQQHGVPVFWLGQEERGAWVRALAQAGGWPEELLAWAFLNPERHRQACGLARNALLLDTVGERFFMMDDDMVARWTRHPRWQPGIACFELTDPANTILYANEQEVERELAWSEWDWWSEMEQRLGSPLAGWAGRAEFDFAQCGPQFLRMACLQPAVLRMVYVGYAGDSGSASNLSHLWARGEAVRQIEHSPADYQAFMRSRHMLRAVAQESWGNAVYTLGGAVGLDHSTLLPPNQPYYRSQDSGFAYLLQEHFPGTVFANLPYGLRHAPMESRSPLGDFCRQTEGRPRVTGVNDLVAAWLQEASGAVGTQEPALRLQRMGQYVTALSEQPPADFEAFSRGLVSRLMCGRLEGLEKLIEERNRQPEYWVRDVERYLQHARLALTDEKGWVPSEILAEAGVAEAGRKSQQFMRRYGQLMTIWPEVMAAARELKAQRKSPARAL